MAAHKLRNPVTESTADANHKKAKLGRAEEKAISEQFSYPPPNPPPH